MSVNPDSLSKKSNAPKSASPTNGKVPGVTWLEAIDDGKNKMINRKIIDSSEDFDI